MYFDFLHSKQQLSLAARCGATAAGQHVDVEMKASR